MCVCVYVWLCVCGFCNVWVCVSVCFVIVGVCMLGFVKYWFVYVWIS